MDKNKEFIELIRHYRHDWLNVLQLIKGNIALNKMNRVEEIISDIVVHTENESKLSNLLIPNVAYEFITFNWRNHFFHLDYEIIGDVMDLSMYEEELHDWCKHFLQLLNVSCLAYNDNSLHITFRLLNDDYRIIFDFVGKIEKDEELVKWLNNEGKEMGKLKVVEKKLTNDEFIVEICLM